MIEVGELVGGISLLGTYGLSGSLEELLSNKSRNEALSWLEPADKSTVVSKSVPSPDELDKAAEESEADGDAETAAEGWDVGTSMETFIKSASRCNSSSTGSSGDTEQVSNEGLIFMSISS